MGLFKVSYSADIFVTIQADSVEEALDEAKQTPITEWYAICTPYITQQVDKEIN
jgi:hypothetical protein